MTGTPKQLTDPPDLIRSAAPLDLLGDVLSRVRLGGAIFLRGEYTAPWAYESPPPHEVAGLLALLHGREVQRLIMFHLVADVAAGSA